MTSASALEYRSRYELVEEARSLGVDRPERMTMQELKDEILRLTLSEAEQQGARGLFGVARAMLASVVEAGLKMPDAARVIRGDSNLDLPARSRSPVATVTLAEIYAAQGHAARALAVLDEVLAGEPDHEEAVRIRRDLLGRVAPPADAVAARQGAVPSTLRRVESAPFETSERGSAAGPEPASHGEFPSTEYVPVDVIETTGHDSAALTPAQADVAPELPAEIGPGPALAVEQRGSTLCLYWELPPETVARSGLTESEGGPAVVVVAFTPAGPSPLRDQRTLPLAWRPPFAGSLVVPDLGQHAAVRAAVGWMVEGTFLPLAVGRPLDRLATDAPELARRAEVALDGLLPPV